MPFTVSKDVRVPVAKIASFRLPPALINSLKTIAKKEGLTVTDLVKQMLQFCVDEYKKGKK